MVGHVTIDSLALNEVAVVLASQKAVAITSDYSFSVTTNISLLWWCHMKHVETYPPFTLKKSPSIVAYCVCYGQQDGDNERATTCGRLQRRLSSVVHGWTLEYAKTEMDMSSFPCVVLRLILKVSDIRHDNWITSQHEEIRRKSQLQNCKAHSVLIFSSRMTFVTSSCCDVFHQGYNFIMVVWALLKAVMIIIYNYFCSARTEGSMSHNFAYDIATYEWIRT